jgi:hypothetical protein
MYYGPVGRRVWQLDADNAPIVSYFSVDCQYKYFVEVSAYRRLLGKCVFSDQKVSDRTLYEEADRNTWNEGPGPWEIRRLNCPPTNLSRRRKVAIELLSFVLLAISPCRFRASPLRKIFIGSNIPSSTNQACHFKEAARNSPQGMGALPRKRETESERERNLFSE